jgi:hypothetical protein
MSDNRSRFVLLCRQALACAVVVAVAAPAARVAELEIVGPGAVPSTSTGPGRTGSPAGSLVAEDAVAPTVTEVPITAQNDAETHGSQDPTVPAGAQRISLMASTVGPTPPGTQPEKTGDGGERIVTRPQDVDGYATVGVTWDTDAPLEEDDIEVRLRTVDDGVWSDWQEVHYDAEHGPDPGSEEAEHQRFGTDAIVVGDVDDVQVKAVTTETELPDDMRLAIVDPGQPEELAVEEPAIDTAELASAPSQDAHGTTSEPEPSPFEEPSGSAELEAAGDLDGLDVVNLAGTPAKVTPKPRIFSRAQWGADERLRDRGSLGYFEVHAGFVHHTVNANGYTRSQVPSIIRGIYAYHTRGRGWSDVGYNFLVDRFGRIWEGRYGGVDRPVVGAHTLGYNEHAFAMSAIGNFETARPSRAMLNAYARLFAWKLSLHGVDADSRRQSVGGRRMPAIRGHRDVGQTACPGRHLYARIGQIRSAAAELQVSFTPRAKDNDLSGTHWPDLVVRDKDTKQAFVVRTGGQLGFDGAGRAAARWGGKDLVAATGDLDGDKVPDMLARNGGSGLTGLHLGDGSGDFGAAVREYRQFRGVDQLIAVGDLNGDGNRDVAGRDAETQRLRLWPGNGHGRFHRPRLLSRNWSGYELTTGVGDLDGDGDADLVARDRDNKVWLVRGTGRNRLGDRKLLAEGWGGYDVIAGLGDLTNDGDPDLVVRGRRSQVTYVYPGNGRGGLQPRLGGFTKFAGIDFLAAAGDVTGTGGADLVGRSRRGHLVVWGNNRKKNIARIVRAGERFPDTNLLLNVGDWNGDGHNDLLSRRASSGELMFHAGRRGGGFEAPLRAGTGWNSVEMVAAAGDLTGDGYPDLLAQHRRGAMRIYPGDGDHGFRRWYVAHSRINATDQVGAGLWNADGSPDSIVRRGDGRLVLYPGNGPGGLTDPRPVGAGANRYDWMVGAGDVDGDNRPDVIGRDPSGRLWLLPGNSSGFDRRRYIGDGFERFDLVG